MKKTVNLLLAIGIMVIVMVLFSTPNYSFGAETIDRSLFDDHDFSSIDWESASSNIKSYTDYRQNHMYTTESYVISFNSAEELYQFSVDVSYKNQALSLNDKKHLMKQNYTLGKDIDYSLIQGARFIPIGYHFILPSNNVEYSLKFSGTFDGRGFEISNLYFSNYGSIVVEDPVANSEIKIPVAISKYYSMFNYVEPIGSVKNIGLINPIVDFPIQHDDINNFSNLVGENNGLVENVFVIESQSIASGGMRIAGTPTNDPTKQKSASGIVHTNNGVFKDAYFAGEGVVNASYIYAIKREAVLYKNNNSNPLDVKNLVHDQTIYKTSVNVGGTIITINAPSNSIGVSTSDLKSGTSHLTSGVWYYYANDRYPALWGLEYDNIGDNYKINNAVDMISFTKLLNLTTINNNLSYNASSYLLISNINFDDVAKDAYLTPEIDFLGVFDGQDKQISNLTLNEGVNVDSGYYVGLFSVLNGTVKNLKLENNQIDIENYAEYFGQHFYIGSITGLLDNGLINNVFVKGSINLGESKLGTFSIGGIAGEANGQIIRVYNEASINLGTHTYGTNEKLGNVFNVGGIVGNATNNRSLVLYNAKNIGEIEGYSANNFQSTAQQVNINIGGVIGYVNNDNIKHNLGLLTNEGDLVVGEINKTGTVTIANHVAGVIGYSTGSTYAFNEFQGLWENDANIIFTSANQTTKAAGVIVSNHNMTMNFVQMFSHSDLTVSNSNVTAAALIYNIGPNININQAKTTGSYNFTINNRSLSVAIHNENVTSKMNLRYIEINTNINIQNTNSVDVSYVGVTLQQNTNYYNVIYNGKFNVEDTNTANTPLWVAGITKELSNGYIMINSMVEGSVNVVGTRRGNIYIGGLVNRNLSGDLHLKDNRTTYPRPKAETGIINSISKTKITSTIDATKFGIRGLTNVFAGGIATMNSGSIQDAVNLEDIKIANLDTYVSNRLTFDSANAGVVSKFESGVILGGVNAIITSGHSRIYDTSNKGNIVGMSEHFVRTGGILGVSLLVELNSGNINNSLYTTTTSSLNGEYISNSVLSNGINYGVVSAVGKTIGVYSTANASQNNRLFFEGGTQQGSTITMRSTVGTQERLPVYASSGGVIGYGLSKMYRMINHGNVYSTDVAGGVVGATFASGGSTPTIVNINTAINYGNVRAINNFFYQVLDKTSITHTYQATELYAPNSNFIIPALANGNVDIRRHPQSKRGIGGVFGRIQRELSHFMTSVGGSFDFVVNMDKDVDLIGRLDQVHNYSSSSRFFEFYDAIYFSAKENDTTQAVFTGFEYTKERDIIVEAGLVQARYIYTSEWSWFRTSYYKQLQYQIPGTMDVYSEEHLYHQLGRRSDFLETTVGTANHPGANWINVGDREEIDRTEHDSGTSVPFSKTITSPEILSTESSIYEFKKVTDVPYISESSTNPNAQYVYDENFVMRDSSVLVDGEPITSFIYYAENALLADRFTNTRPDGMYVLASSAGSNFGAVLPRNLKITNFKTLSRIIPTNINYTNIRLNPGFEESTGNTSWLINDPTLVTSYESLYQTKLNDKSALLEDNQIFEIKDQNSSKVKLDNPVITGNVITFNIYKDMLGSNLYLDFNIISALLPSNALIAKTDATFNALNNTTDINIATGTLAPNLTIDLTGKTGVVELGKFISFSEAAINDIAFYGQIDGKYQTEYTIYLNIIEQTINLPIGPEVMIDNQTTWGNYVNNKVTITDKLGVRFRDRTVANGGFISSSFVMDDYLTLYYIDNNSDRIIVNESYYTITSTKKDANRYFSFVIDFSEKLRPGDRYVIGYKFFPQDQEKDIFVNYNREVVNEITNLIANTGTYYEKDASINGNVAFGDESLLGGITYTKITNNSIPEYLDNTTYQLANIKYFETSDFFDITNLGVIQQITDGYYTYHLAFTLSSGNDVDITLAEDQLDKIYYKNGIRIPTGTTTIKRESLQTSLSVDYNFIPAVENTFDLQDFIIKVDGQLLNDFDPNATKIMTTYHNGIIRFIVTDKLLPKLNGTIVEPYNITIEIERGTFTIDAGNLVITKLQGTNSYLKDIKFSTIISETSYPEINISDIDGNIITSPYNTSIYYAGIDYNNSDRDKKTDFRVEGKVQKVPLDEFLPYMIEYLPIGASIQRKLYDTNTQQEAGYTNSVSVEDLTFYNDLFADFTRDPKTGMALVDDEVAVITYKVTSEDNSHSVYYHVAVTDVTNNVTLSFDFTYKDSLGNIIDISDLNSPLKTNLFTLNVLNHDVTDITYLSGTNQNTVINEVANFPTFTGIDKTNTTTNMFYAPYITGLSYRFARNLSGIYQIRIDVPANYKYTIYFKNGVGTTSEEELELFPIYDESDNNRGYYFYINWSESLRTRSFRVEISDKTEQPGWGLTDQNLGSD